MSLKELKVKRLAEFNRRKIELEGKVRMTTVTSETGVKRSVKVKAKNFRPDFDSDGVVRGWLWEDEEVVV